MIFFIYLIFSTFMINSADTPTYPPLTPELFMTPYWESMRNATQEEKNIAFYKATKKDNNKGDDMHIHLRLDIAAALEIGAQAFPVQKKINGKRWHTNLVTKATMRNDTELLKKLFDRNATVHEYNADNNTPIHYAKNIDIAKMLIAQGALKSIPNDLLHVQMYEPYGLTTQTEQLELIKLYKEHGASPLTVNKNNFTPLMTLVTSAIGYTPKDIVEKATALCDDLTVNQIQRLIFYKEPRCNKNVFDFINDQYNTSSENTRKALAALDQFLYKRR